jgi:lipoprotein-anchoring transpeptidase ErfK/SrfK
VSRLRLRGPAAALALAGALAATASAAPLAGPAPLRPGVAPAPAAVPKAAHPAARRVVHRARPRIPRTMLQASRRLVALGYLPAGGVTRILDARGQNALLAFQGWEGLPRTAVLDDATARRLATADRPHPIVGSSRAVEILRARGVALLVRGDRVVRAIHVSTGAPGRATPSGSFRVYRKERMSWSRPFSAWLPYASYFTGGIALHEYPSVPAYPASHGCVRVPHDEAPTVYGFATDDTRVVVV